MELKRKWPWWGFFIFPFLKTHTRPDALATEMFGKPMNVKLKYLFGHAYLIGYTEAK